MNETPQTGWYLKDTDIPIEFPEEGAIGFVYLITSLVDGRMYIGKKKVSKTKTSQKTITLKSGIKKKKKIKTLVESDWQDYYGSSEELKAEVEKHGKDKFRREILRFCSKLGEMSYYEAKYQFHHEVLEHPEKYFNAWISCRVRRNHL